MFVDKMGFEHTGHEGFLSRMTHVWDQYELEVQERDAEWEKYFNDHGLDCFEHRKNDPRLTELVNKGIPDKHRKAVCSYLPLTLSSFQYLFLYFLFSSPLLLMSWQVWLALIGYNNRAMPGYYNDLLGRSSLDSRPAQDIAQVFLALPSYTPALCLTYQSLFAYSILSALFFYIYYFVLFFSFISFLSLFPFVGPGQDISQSPNVAAR